MSTADVLTAFPHLKGFKRKSKATFENLEFRLFADPQDEDNMELTCEDTVTGKIEVVNNDAFYDFENLLSKELKAAISNETSLTSTILFNHYLSLVNNSLKVSFVKALSAELYSRSPWGSLATIMKDIKKMLSQKTIEFDDDMNLSSPADNYGEVRIFFFPKDMSEEFADASFRIELSFQETNPQSSFQVEIITD